VALRAVFGQDEANHGLVRYRVDNDGLVWVPSEAVPSLTSRGGFVVARNTTGPIQAFAEDRSPGSGRGVKPSLRAEFGRAVEMIKLHHDNAAGCSYGGRYYPGDENGDVLVPAEAVPELVAHGYWPLPQAASPSKSSKPSSGAGLRKS
jgi:hypothetical protein